jgi:L-alanine-DL-glutamate epimerase-like enolase superfamily enzyme
MHIKHYPFTLKLAKEFRISYETRTEQQTLIVELLHNGKSGYGEATAISYYHITINEMITKLKEVTTLLKNYDFTHPKNLWNFLSPILLKKHSFLLSAIDSAAYDLYGKLNNERSIRYISSDSLNTPLSNYTISIGTTEKMINQISDKPWPIYKLKLDTESSPNTLVEIRKMTDSTLRIDANASWNLEIANKWLPFLEDANIELIEQPFAVDNYDDLDKFRDICNIPIIADESCQKLEDVEFCAKHFDGINIKLMKCGGLTPAIKMIKLAKELNLKLMAGCMTESSVGISAMTQIAPFLDYIDADGAILISNDPAEGVKIINGKIIYPDEFGFGINLKK